MYHVSLDLDYNGKGILPWVDIFGGGFRGCGFGLKCHIDQGGSGVAGKVGLDNCRVGTKDAA